MFESTSFNVVEQPVYVPNPRFNLDPTLPQFIPVEGEKAIVREDTGHVLSIMSKSYVPLRDIDVMDKVMELFNTANIEVIPINHHLTQSKDGVVGRTTFMEVELPQYNLFPDTPELQRLRIVVPNSFDGTSKLKMMIMLWRQICSNGMMGWKSDFEFGFKHRTGALDRLGDALNLYLLNQLEQNTLVVNLLGNVLGNTDSILAYLQNNKILTGERWQEKLMGAWLQIDTSVNLWQLYNLFTNQITHHYGRNFSTKITKLKLLNEEVKHVWGKVLGTPDSFQDAILIA